MAGGKAATRDKHMMSIPTVDNAFSTYRFSSYGVRIEIRSNDADVVKRAREVATRSLLGDLRTLRTKTVDHVFELPRTKSGIYKMLLDGEVVSGASRSATKFFKFFDAMVRVTVGEYAVDRVFLHAGVVSWRGKGIIMPADSFQGKTTLTAELVKQGAAYVSDEFAVLDAEGRVHPFARPLSMRLDDEGKTPYERTAEELGGTYATEPVPVGTVLLTGYTPGARWRPRILTPGEGVLKMMPYTLSLRYKPNFSLKVLNSVASRAIIASSRRDTAENFAKTFLNFVDKHVN